MGIKLPRGPTPRYSTDRVRVYHNDARRVIESLPRVDLVVADPPYASGARRNAEKTLRGKKMIRSQRVGDWFAADSMTSIGYDWLIWSTFSLIRQRMKEGDHVYVFTDWRQVSATIGALESVDFRVNHTLVWDKTYFGMGAYFRNQYENIVFASVGQPRLLSRRDVGSVLSFKPVSPSVRRHPTEKPIDLLRLLISVSSSSNDVVFDPFCGSGSTLIAALHENRRAIGVDINPTYTSIAVDRLRKIC